MTHLKGPKQRREEDSTTCSPALEDKMRLIRETRKTAMVFATPLMVSVKSQQGGEVGQARTRRKSEEQLSKKRLVR